MSKWISSRTRLPKESGKYIICDKNLPNSAQQIFYHADSQRWEYTMANNDSEEMFEKVEATHWMPFLDLPVTKLEEL